MRGATDGRWNDVAAQALVNKGLPSGSGSSSEGQWSANHDLLGVPRTFRCFKVINTTWDLYKASTTDHEDLAMRLYTDFQQNTDQKNHFHELICTPLTSTELYHYGSDRVLFAQEYFSLLGFPTMNLEGVSISQARDMVGESLAVPVITSLCTGLAISVEAKDLWDMIV